MRELRLASLPPVLGGVTGPDIQHLAVGYLVPAGARGGEYGFAGRGLHCLSEFLYHVGFDLHGVDAALFIYLNALHDIAALAFDHEDDRALR